MNFELVCTLDDVWEGDMAEFELDGQSILLVWPRDGEIHAFQGICPHQDIPLVEGKVDGKTLMCRAHQWTFDGTTGVGVNPKDCRLAEYPVKIDGDNVYVALNGIQPVFAHT